ncbi:MAG: hypothetical protein M1570_12385 [Chloroflexi bacterium]|nr:hypothetical protein [Chloroflexota bacterium]
MDLETGVTEDLGLSTDESTRCQVSPDQHQLACDDSEHGKHPQIVVFDLATKQRRTITSFRNDCQDPTWSPDGKSLVYWIGNAPEQIGKEVKPAGNHLAIYSFETGEHHLLTKAAGSYDAYPSWSPDGQWISFHRKGQSRGEWNIWMIRPDGSELMQLTAGKVENTYPSWSPDSKQIAFQCYRRKSGTYDICAVEVANKRVYSVTNNPKIDAWQPVWIK